MMRKARGRTITVFLATLTVVAGGCVKTAKNEERSQAVSAANAHRIGQPILRPDSTVVVVLRENMIAAIRDTQEIIWTKVLEGESIVTAPAVAQDSTTYLLTSAALRAYDVDGNERFKHTLPFGNEDNVRDRSMMLLASSDSSAIVSDGVKRVVKIDARGEQTWDFTLPEGDHLVAPVAIGPNGSAYLRTAAYLYVVGADGEVRWRQRLANILNGRE